MFKDKKLKGFTLAEVLITLTIIGVVSAMTIPALQNNVGTQALEKQTLKMYSQLQSMIERYKVDNNVDRLTSDFASDSNITKYMKVAQICYTPNECFASSYTNVNGGTTYSIGNIAKQAKCYQLQDGTSFGIANNLMVFFDVNGKKKPNKIGYDMWLLSIKTEGNLNGYITDPNTGSLTSTKQNIQTRLNACLNGTSKYGCFGHFIRNGFKFDY